MTPQEFLAKWRPVTLSERSACQSHFNDLCLVLGQPQPVTADPDEAWYTFDRCWMPRDYDRDEASAYSWSLDTIAASR